jgi:hypothetical protein
MSEPQTKTVVVEFKVSHTPGNDEHMNQMLETYFRAKGITYKDGVIVI